MVFELDTKLPKNIPDAWSAGLQNAKRAALEKFGEHMLHLADSTFGKLASGGTYRGVSWPPFRRKPARPGPKLLRDTGRLRASVGEVFKIQNGKLLLGTDVPYAAYQQKMRPFLFFETPTDAQTAARMAAQFINRELGGAETRASEGK